MGWVTLTERKLSLRESIHDGQMGDLNLGRNIRQNQRQLSLETTLIQNEMQRQIEKAKDESGYQKLEKERKNVSVGDSDYQEWSDNFKIAQEKYQELKTNIQDEFDIVLQNIEEEATDKEERLTDEQTVLETNLEAWNQELQSISDAISSNIESSKIKLS